MITFNGKDVFVIWLLLSHVASHLLDQQALSSVAPGISRKIVRCKLLIDFFPIIDSAAVNNIGILKMEATSSSGSITGVSPREHFLARSSHLSSLSVPTHFAS
jgi:hypothetical protein